MQTNSAQAQQPGQLQVAGETHIGNEVIASIVGMAARDVEGVASLGKSSVGTAIGERVGSRETRARGVAVEAGRKEAILAIELRVVYGFSIPQVVEKVRESVAQRILALCGLVAKEIRVNIVGIEFPDKLPGRLG